MRKSIFVAVVAVVLAAGLGVSMAQLGGPDDGKLELGGPDDGKLELEAPSPSASRTPASPTHTAAAAPSGESAAETSEPVPPTRPSGSSIASPSGPVPQPPTQEPPPFLPESRPVEPRPGMENLRRTGWERAELLGDNRLRIHFVSGVEPCTVLDHVDVEYRPGEIAVTLYEGNDPSARETACIMIAQYKAVDVPLSEAVNGRPIVDGAR